jgi:ABC-type antimicrobial peptide transport system permease subunit
MVLVGTLLGLLIAHGLIEGARSYLIQENPTANFDKVFAPIGVFLLPLLLAALLVGVLAAIYPSVRTAYTDPAKVLQS